MITITNPKVAGFVPRWARFRGFSLLFDGNLIPAGPRLDLANDVDADSSLDFYRGLRDGLAALDPDLLTATYLFCPLPPPSYHVTVWDGGNDGNIAQVHGDRRPELEQLLAGLPDSLLRPNALIDRAAASPLVTHPDWDVTLRFDRLNLWGNAVLVARLAPTEESASALEALAEERRRLSQGFRAEFGIAPSDRYSPHVSLGYFASREAAQLATPCLEGWDRVMAERMQGRTLSLKRVGVYGFTDMATFFKARPL